ncbi:MAG: DUF418 domain-containing protein [Gemmatimonadetes bacterium]|nr:DUF418 domain-containing protein [Gemmatimonadota bacterium]
MNIGAFSMPAAAYFNPSVYGDLAGMNGWIWRLTHVLADMKFMAIFSMLFGAGIVLMTDRPAVQGRAAAALHRRRMMWLIVFGLLHAHLLWYDDILFWYGLCGLVVFPFRRLPPKRLVLLGIASIGIASLISLAGGWTLESWPSEMLESVSNDLAPPADALAAEITAYRGGWVEQMSERVPRALEMETITFLSWAVWRVSGLMLLGMALFKLGVLTGSRSPRFYRGLVAVAGLVGIPMVVFGLRRNVASGWDTPEFFLLGLQYNYWGSLLVSLGWIGAVMLVCGNPNLARWTRPLAAVGRTAFTNYILQTVICTTIFYGHGFGLFGRVERTGQALIVLSVWAFQLAVSPLWLRRFRYGPLEWLWRSLAYKRRQPFRRLAHR